jgi:uncharacterized protein DUF4381
MRAAVGALALVLAAVLTLAQSPAGQQGVRLGVTVQPETVTVGDPFIVRLRLRAPAGARMSFPEGPDSTSAVELLDPRAITTSPDPSAVDQTAIYRLVAWDVGVRQLGLGDAVALVDNVPQRVSLGDVRVFVRSVLPADSAQRIPKPARALIEPPAPWWWPWLPILIALAIIGLLLWWYIRRRRRRKGPFREVDPYELAEREFARIEALGLLEAGERGRFVALMVDVLRDYLARRLPGAAPSLTSSELLALVGANRSVPLERLGPVLSEADLIKFARRNVSADRARELGREAHSIVRDVDKKVKQPAPTEAAA